MATRKNNTADTLPAAWGTDAEELETRVLINKDTLIGVPMKILGFEIERNEKRGYDVAYVYALDKDGMEFTFADSADTGVRGQIQKAAVDKGLTPTPGSGYQALPLIVLGGLRVSEYEGPNGPAKTFYLEGKARRAG